MSVKLKKFFILLSIFMVVVFSCNNETPTPTPNVPAKPVGKWQAVVDGKKTSYEFKEDSTYEIIEEYDNSKEIGTYSTAAPDKLVLSDIGTFSFRKEGESLIIPEYIGGGCLTLAKYNENPRIEPGVFETTASGKTVQIEIDAENRTYTKTDGTQGRFQGRFTLTDPNRIHFFENDVYKSTEEFSSSTEELTIGDIVYTRVRIPEIGIYQIIGSSPKETIEITDVNKLDKTVTLSDGSTSPFTYEGDVLVINEIKYEKYVAEIAATPLYDKNYSYYDANGILSFYTFKEDKSYTLTVDGTPVSGTYSFAEPYLIKLGETYVPFQTNDKLVVDSKEYNINSTAHNIELGAKGIILKPAYDNNSKLESYSIIGGNSASVILTNSYNNLPITGVEKEAFKGNTNITSITFEQNGDSHFIISESAFEGVKLSFGDSGLVVLSIPAWVTEIKSRAFADTNIGEVDYDKTLTDIESDAFDETPYKLYPRDGIFVYAYINNATELSVCSLINKELTTIVIPDSYSVSGVDYKITAIGDNAFNGIDTITEVTLGNKIKAIGAKAFAETYITTINIPASVTEFGVGAFENSKLETASGNSIPWYAVVGTPYDITANLTDGSYVYERVGLNGKDFSSYKLSSVNSLTDVTIPATFKDKSVTDVNIAALSDVTKLTIAEDSSISALDLTSLTSLEALVLNKGVTTLDNIKLPAVKTLDLSKTGITKLTTDVNYEKLKGALESIIMPKGLAEMEDNVFWNFQKLATVTFDMTSPITTIPVSAFAQATSLKEVNLPSKVTVIGATAFAESGLTTLTRNGSKIDVSSGISAEYSTFYKTPYESTFLSDSTLKYEYVFATTTMKAARRASYQYNPDKTPSGIAVAGFVSDSAVVSEITIPATLVNGIEVTDIAESAFENKTLLTTVNFAENSKLKNIRSKAFLGTGIKNITLPPSVGSVWADAFSQEAGDTITIIFNSDPVIEREEEKPYYIYDNLFKYQVNFSKDKKMESLILKGFKDNAKKPSNLVIPAVYETNGLAITSIDTGAFSGDSTITSLAFAENSVITEIPSTAFAQTTALKSVDFSNVPGITINGYAFESSAIESISSADGVKYENYAFSMCTNLESINSETSAAYYLNLEESSVMEVWAFKGTLLETNYLLQDDNYSYAYSGSYPESCTYAITDYKHKESPILEKQIVTIPATFRNRDIDYIGKGSFTSQNATLREVTFPETSPSTNIYVQEGAFSENPNLVKVVLAGNEKLENHAFYNCENLFDVTGYKSEMAANGFPFEGTPFLPNYVAIFEFTENESGSVSITGLKDGYDKTTLRIPAKVQLETGEKSVTEIVVSAFENNKTIEKVVIDDGELTELPIKAFNNTNIKSVVINDNDLAVRAYAFGSTKSLESVEAGENVRFDMKAFESSKYESTVEDGFRYNLLIDNGQRIGYEVVYYSNSDVSQIKPAHFDSLPVTTISGTYPGVTSAQIEKMPDSITLIEDAFEGFTGTVLTIPDNVKEISNSFDKAMKIENVIVLDSCIIYYNFNKHWNSETILSSFDKTPFKEKLFLNYWYSVADGKISINGNNGEVPLAEGRTSLLLPSEINEEAIEGVAANGFTTNQNADIEFPSSYIAIEQSAFEGNKDIESIVITNPECRLGNRAFANCTNLMDVIIPEEGLKHEIPADAFVGTTWEKDFNNLALFDFYPYVIDANEIKVFVDNKNAVSIKDDKGAEITFTGYLVAAKSNNNNADVVIPSAWRGKEVNGIYTNGFKGKTSIKTVTFESRTESSSSPLEYILHGAFSGCTNLEEIIVNGRFQLDAPKIKSDAFDGTKNQTLGFKHNGFYISFNASNGEMATVTIKGSYLKDNTQYQVPYSVMDLPVTTITNSSSGWGFPAGTSLSFLARDLDIPDNCFLDVANIVNVDFTNVKKIGDSAFKGTSFTSFTLDSKFTSIGTTAIPATVEKVTVSADATLQLLASYFVSPSAVTSIKTDQTAINASLAEFTGVEKLTLSDVTSIADGAFGPSLQELTIRNSENNTFTLTSGMMDKATNLQSVYLSNIALGENAFNGKTSLTTIDSNSSIVSIGSGALVGTSITSFAAKSELTSIAAGALPKTLKRLELIAADNLVIDNIASFFETSDSYALEYVRMPLKITAFSADGINFTAFDNLKEISIKASSIGDGVFPASLETLSLNDESTITEITNKWFTPKGDGTYALTSINIPDSVTSIADRAFEKFVNLTLKYFHQTKVQSIGISALAGIPNTYLTLPATVTSIGKDAFSSTITSIDLSNTTITSVGDWLSDNSSLVEIRLPNTVTTIEDYAFVDATESAAFRFFVGTSEANSTGSIVSIGANAFQGTKIGDGAQFALKIEPALKSIGNSAFEGTMISKINLPGTLESVGANAFANLDTTSTKELTVGDGNIQLGSLVDGAMVGAFGGSNLSTVDFSKNTKITTIEDYMFDGAIRESGNGVTKLILNPAQTALNTDAFSSSTYDPTSNLVVVGLNQLTTIGADAFKNVRLFASIEDYNTGKAADFDTKGKTIGAGAFTNTVLNELTINVSDTSALGTGIRAKTVVLEDGVTTIGASTFADTTTYYLDRLERITIPASVTTIGDKAFYGQKNLDTVFVPNINADISAVDAFVSSTEITTQINGNTIAMSYGSKDTINVKEYDGTATIDLSGIPASLFSLSTATNITLLELPATVSTLKLPDNYDIANTSSIIGSSSALSVVTWGKTTMSNENLERLFAGSPFYEVPMAVDGNSEDIILRRQVNDSATGYYYMVTGPADYSGATLTIPESYNGILITHIADNAFATASNLTSVNASHIDYFGHGAFSIPKESVTIKDGLIEGTDYFNDSFNSGLIVSGDYQFRKATEEYSSVQYYLVGVVDKTLSSYTLPATLTVDSSPVTYAVAAGAFDGCTTATTLTFPEYSSSYQGIHTERGAFRGLINLESAAGVTHEFNIKAFEGNPWFEFTEGGIRYERYSGDADSYYLAAGRADGNTATSLTFTYILSNGKICGGFTSNAFCNDSSLISVTIDPNIEIYSWYSTFVDCTNLEFVNYKYYYGEAFKGTKWYSNNFYEDPVVSGLVYAKMDNNEWMAEGSVNSVSTLEFLSSIPGQEGSSVTAIGSSLFIDDIVQITIPASITTIKQGFRISSDSFTGFIFEGSSRPTVEGDFVSMIDSNSPYMLYTEESTGVTYRRNSFDAWSLDSYNYSSSSSTYSILSEVNGEPVTNVKDLDGSIITSLVIPASIKTVNDGAFYDLYNLVNVHCPGGENAITWGYDNNKASCFYPGCPYIVNSIPESDADLDSVKLRYVNNSYYEVTTIKAEKGIIVIPASYKEVPITSFASDVYIYGDKSQITSVDLGSIKEIPADMFNGCYNLRTVIGDAPLTIGDRAFWGCLSLTTKLEAVNTETNAYSFSGVDSDFTAATTAPTSIISWSTFDDNARHLYSFDPENGKLHGATISYVSSESQSSYGEVEKHELNVILGDEITTGVFPLYAKEYGENIGEIIVGTMKGSEAVLVYMNDKYAGEANVLQKSDFYTNLSSGIWNSDSLSFVLKGNIAYITNSGDYLYIDILKSIDETSKKLVFNNLDLSYTYDEIKKEMTIDGYGTFVKNEELSDYSSVAGEYIGQFNGHAAKLTLTVDKTYSIDYLNESLTDVSNETYSANYDASEFTFGEVKKLCQVSMGMVSWSEAGKDAEIMAKTDDLSANDSIEGTWGYVDSTGAMTIYSFSKKFLIETLQQYGLITTKSAEDITIDGADNNYTVNGKAYRILDNGKGLYDVEKDFIYFALLGSRLNAAPLFIASPQYSDVLIGHIELKNGIGYMTNADGEFIIPAYGISGGQSGSVNYTYVEDIVNSQGEIIPYNEGVIPLAVTEQEASFIGSGNRVMQYGDYAVYVDDANKVLSATRGGKDLTVVTDGSYSVYTNTETTSCLVLVTYGENKFVFTLTQNSSGSGRVFNYNTIASPAQISTLKYFRKMASGADTYYWVVGNELKSTTKASGDTHSGVIEVVDKPTFTEVLDGYLYYDGTSYYGFRSSDFSDAKYSGKWEMVDAPDNSMTFDESTSRITVASSDGTSYTGYYACYGSTVHVFQDDSKYVSFKVSIVSDERISIDMGDSTILEFQKVTT